MTRTILSVLVFFLGGFVSMYAPKPAQKSAPKTGAHQQKGDTPLSLGKFSVSLAVKDLAASRAFYEKLGFHAGHGDNKKWIVMQNETTTISLFQGMIEKNSLLFNPGWDSSKKTLPDFQDVREIQKELKKRGLTLTTAADESSTGPASLSLLDPDGNPVLIDQYVPKPKK